MNLKPILIVLVLLTILTTVSAVVESQDRTYYNQITTSFSQVTNSVYSYNGINYILYKNSSYTQLNIVGLDYNGTIVWGPYNLVQDSTCSGGGYQDCIFGLPAKMIRSIENDGFVVFATAYRRVHLIKIYDNGTVDSRVLDGVTGIANYGYNVQNGWLSIGKGENTYAAYIHGGCNYGMGAVFNQDLTLNMTSSITNYSQCTNENPPELFDYNNDFYLMINIYGEPATQSRYLWINKTNPQHTMYSQYQPHPGSSFGNYYRSWAYDSTDKSIFVFSHNFFGGNGQSYIKKLDVSSIGATITELSSYMVVPDIYINGNAFRSGKRAMYLGDTNVYMAAFISEIGNGTFYSFDKTDLSSNSYIEFNSTLVNLTAEEDGSGSNFYGTYVSNNVYTFFDAKGFVKIVDTPPYDPCGIYSGSGTELDPYQITDIYQLQDISQCSLTASYALMNDIDASDTVNWNAGAGFVSLGYFTGILDGQGYTIDSLFMNNEDAFTAIFDHIETADARIQNLQITNLDITSTGAGGEQGGLVGELNEGTIENVTISGTVTGTDSVGGIAGGQFGIIKNCSFTGTVNGVNYVGGIAGQLDANNPTIDGKILDSYSDATVSGMDFVGGLVGTGSGEISNSYAIGTVFGDNYIGGLVASYDGLIYDSYATGNIAPTGAVVGGLVGQLLTGGLIQNSYATGDIILTGQDFGGGLVGDNTGIINNSYATGNVFGDLNIGGLVGSSTGSIYGSHATGIVTGTIDSTGGLAGRASGIISDSYSISNVTGVSSVGGLIGATPTTETTIIYNSNFSGVVIGNGASIGGLVGQSGSDLSGNIEVYNSHVDAQVTNILEGGDGVSGFVGKLYSGIIDNSSFTGDVHCEVCSQDVGGLSGISYSEINISSSYVNANVYGMSFVGGLSGTPAIGYQHIKDSYFVGNVVTTTGGGYVGGLTPYLGTDSTIENSYVIGNIVSEDSNIGGLVGSSEPGSSILNSHAVVDLVGASSMGGLVGSGSNMIITNSHFNGTLTGANADTDLVGGLVGTESGSIISNSYATGNITNVRREIGGLIGLSADSSEIYDSYANVDIDGVQSLGGLLGRIGGGQVDNCYATGDISGNDVIGGFVGEVSDYPSTASVSNSYATGTVQVSDNTAGGFAGSNFGTITSSYSTGLVIGDNYVGGFVAENNLDVIDSYWDIESSNKSFSAGSEVGLTTAQMKIQTNLQGFDFENIWGQDDGYEYPQLGPKVLKLLSYSCENVSANAGSTVQMPINVQTNDGSKLVDLSGIPAVCDGDNCNATMQYYYAPGEYDLLVTMTNNTETLHRIVSAVCNYGEIQATVRDKSNIQFSGATYGVQNKTSDTPLVFENLGNKEITVAYLTGYDLQSAVPGYTLSVSNFRAGLTLNNSVQLQNNTPVSVPFELVAGQNSKVNFYVWSSIPSSQYPTQYVATKQWELNLE